MDDVILQSSVSVQKNVRVSQHEITVIIRLSMRAVKPRKFDNVQLCNFFGDCALLHYSAFVKFRETP